MKQNNTNKTKKNRSISHSKKPGTVVGSVQGVVISMKIVLRRDFVG